MDEIDLLLKYSVSQNPGVGMELGKMSQKRGLLSVVIPDGFPKRMMSLTMMLMFVRRGKSKEEL